MIKQTLKWKTFEKMCVDYVIDGRFYRVLSRIIPIRTLNAACIKEICKKIQVAPATMRQYRLQLRFVGKKTRLKIMKFFDVQNESELFKKHGT
jgi:hypothetical protein